MKTIKFFYCSIISFSLLLIINFTTLAQNSHSHSEMEKLVNQMFEAWSTDNPALIDSIFAEDGVYEDVPGSAVVQGREKIKDLLKQTTTAIPDFNIKLLKWFSSSGQAACQWEMKGTQTGIMGNMPPTGKSFSVRGASFVKIKDSKITKWTDYYDSYSFLKQIGAIE